MKKFEYYTKGLGWLKFYIFLWLPILLITRVWNVIKALMNQEQYVFEDFLWLLLIAAAYIVSYVLIIYFDKTAFIALIFINLFYIVEDVIPVINMEVASNNFFLALINVGVWIGIAIDVVCVSLNLAYFISRRSLFFIPYRILREDAEERFQEGYRFSR